ncbi:ATP-NAD kinase-like domain-containing protein [Chlamydoabsidia padenii]|nr:ATP-NAD kinase-like domain-containing protein [Chlamydoabsidia padenii]
MTTISATYLDQPATLTIKTQVFEITQHDKTTVYPFQVIYGIHPDAKVSTLTIDVYLSPATLGNVLGNDAQQPLDNFGQHALTFKIEPWTDHLDETFQSFRSLALPVAVNTRIYPFLNPTSGNQMAKTLWTTFVQPMLRAAGFNDYAPVVETKANQVRQQAYQLGQALEQEALIVCLGGDGTLHDLLNGLYDCLSDNDKTTFRLGVIPAGSGNAFALSLNLHPQDIGQAVLRIIHGNPKPFHLLDIDIGQATQNDDDWVNHVVIKTPLKRRVFVVVSWGFHAQILAKSRYLRYIMGNKRFSLVAMALLLFLHHYKGDLVMRQVRQYNRHTCSFEEKDPTKVMTLSSDDNKGGFTYFLATKQASLEPGFTITPFASPFSQDIDVLCMRQATADQLKTVAGLAFQGGQHVDHEAVDYYKTDELLLRVHEATDICLDGELVPVRAMDVIRVRSIRDQRGAFTVFV